MNDSNSELAEFEGASVLVVGGSGFIGSYLCRRLIEIGVVDLTVLGRRELTVRDLGLSSSKACVNYVKLDLGSAEQAKAYLKLAQYQFIFNLSGVIDQGMGENIYSTSLKNNLLPTLNILEAINSSALKRFVHVGTNAEYGNADCPQHENSPTLPTSAYGVMKLAATKAVLAKGLEGNLPASVVRPFSVFGEGMGERTFLRQAALCARNSKVLEMSSGVQTRDFVHVADVVADILEVALSGDTVGRVKNSCSGVEKSLNEVIELLSTVCPKLLVKRNLQPGRAFECPRSVGVPWKYRSIEDTNEKLLLFFKNALR